MARAYLAAPGTKHGPCEAPCSHMDCEAERRMAAEVCRLCGQPIGYECGWYHDRQRGFGLVHADCMDEQLEKEWLEKERLEKEREAAEGRR